MLISQYIKLTVYSYLGIKEVFTKISKLSRKDRQCLANSNILSEARKMFRIFITEAKMKDLEIELEKEPNLGL